MIGRAGRFPHLPAHAVGAPPRPTVGLMGGSFNPAHEGHRHLAETAIKRLRLGELWWLVSPQNPLKSGRDMAPLAVRLAGARALARHPAMRVLAIEDGLGSRYSADTLDALVRRFPRTRFVWLMGADNLRQIASWRRWSDIFHAAVIAVFARPSYDSHALTGKAARRFAAVRRGPAQAGRLARLAPPAWVFLHTRLHPASATAIRRENEAGGAR